MFIKSADDIYLRSNGNDGGIDIHGQGAVDLYHNGSAKLSTTSTGIDILGSDTTGSNLNGDLIINNAAGTRYAVFDASDTKLNFSDNAKVTLGTSNDLQIYHDGTDSYILDNGAGVLNIKTNGTSIDLTKTPHENLARFIIDGAVELYHDNVKKFETLSTGCAVTGELDVSGNIDLNSDSHKIKIEAEIVLHFIFCLDPLYILSLALGKNNH